MSDAKAPDDEHWMRIVLALARRAVREDDEVPVAALVLGPDGGVLGQGWNRNISEHDPSAHAEIVALRAAGRALANYRLLGCTVYVSLEPCAMCAMAMVHARIARLVYGARDPKTGADGSAFDLLRSSRHNHRIEVCPGVLGDDAAALLSEYFRGKRGQGPKPNPN